MKLVNLTPHPIRLVRSECPDNVKSLDGWIDREYPSAGQARLSMDDHGSHVVYGRPEGIPRSPEPGVAYVVSLTVALALLAQGWPSAALRVPLGDIRLASGTRAGACRRIVEPRVAPVAPGTVDQVVDQVITVYRRMQRDPANADFLADCPNGGTCQMPYLCVSCECLYGHACDEVHGVEPAPPPANLPAEVLTQVERAVTEPDSRVHRGRPNRPADADQQELS